MKRLLTIAALLVAPLGCVANNGAGFVRMLNARAFTSTDCTTSTTLNVSSGALDLSGPDSYLIAMSVETNTAQQNISVGQTNFQGSGLSDITIYQVVYSYEFSDASAGLTLPKEETAPIYSVFRPQADPTANAIILNAIGPQALAVLQTYYRAHPASTATIVSHIKGKAYLSGGQETETNVIRFPVVLFTSGYSDSGGCPGPKEVVARRCGATGQDASVCISAP